MFDQFFSFTLLFYLKFEVISIDEEGEMGNKLAELLTQKL
jgi:phage-related holin